MATTNNKNLNNMSTGWQIPRQVGDGPFPASFSQARLFFLDELYEGAPVYNEVSARRLTGFLDVEALERAFTMLISRHEVLRTTYDMGDQGPVQIVQPLRPFKLPLIDLRHLDQTQWEQTWRQLVANTAGKPFDLRQDLLIRGRLYQLRDNEYILLQVKHHIATDGWSERVIRRELKLLYEAALQGRPSPLPALPIQYKDYAVWQKAEFEKPAQAKILKYWEDQLAGLAPLELAADFPRPPQSNHPGRIVWFELSAAQKKKIDALARSEKVTHYMLLLAAFYILLQRYSNQDDIAVGTPVANRHMLETEKLIGFFVNTVVMRADLSGSPTFRELLKRVRRMTLSALDHQRAPFEQVIGVLQPGRHLSRNPLFQVLFQVVSGRFFDPDSHAALVDEPVSADSGIAKFDLEVSLWQRGADFLGRWRYSSELFTESTAQRMIGHYLQILDSIVADPDQPVTSLAMLAKDELRQIEVDWNDSCAPFDEQLALHHMVEKMALKQPMATAVSYRDQDLTYQELNIHANRLARHLVLHGVKPGMPVALLQQRSPQMLIAILAILKAGAAYVPIDPAYPAERQRIMLQDCGAAVLLASSDQPDNRSQYNGETVWLDRPQEWAGEEGADLNLPLSTRLPAYIIYTSGSTGTPKGVAMSHRALSNLLQWQARDKRLGQSARTLQLTPLIFDVSCQEIFSTWQLGGTIIVVDNETGRNPYALIDYLEEQAIERIFVPTVTLQLLGSAARQRGQLPLSLRDIVCAGEQLALSPDIRLLLKDLPDCRLHNHYGPTETHVVTSFTLPADTVEWPQVAPIGRPIANTALFVRDPSGNPAPVGVPGELYIAGEALADGYWQQPELTAERFRAAGDGSGRILYRTGDWARWLPRGILQFIGREDDQIKIRGYRVELGEVESLLRKHVGVQEAVVVANGEGDQKRLIAYIVTDTGTAVGEREFDRYLRQLLPDYMLPAGYVLLDEIPLTPSGKINRRGLPAPEMDVRREPSSPHTLTEAILLDIWRDVLQIDTLGIDDDFFESGGHSLLGIRLFANIEDRFNVRLPLSLLFQSGTVAALAQQLEEPQIARANEVLVPIQSGGTLPPFFCVHGFGGGVVGYADLAKALGPDQPFYGLQAFGLDGNGESDDSIEAMATRYTGVMRRFQPRGPYFLGGYCFGGVVAFEMARQLEAAGEECAVVAVIEGYAPRPYHEWTSLYHPRRFMTIWRNIPFWTGELYAVGSPRLRSRVRIKYRQTAARLRRRLGLQHTDPALKDLVDVELEGVPEGHRQLMMKHLQALGRYNAGRYNGRVTLFRAQYVTFSSAVFGSQDPTHGWDALALGGVEVKEVAGAHHNIHMKPHVKSLAEKLGRLLQEKVVGAN